MDRIFALPAIVFLLIFAVVAFLIRLIFGALRGEGPGAAALPALETAAMTLIGGFISRMFDQHSAGVSERLARRSVWRWAGAFSSRSA